MDAKDFSTMTDEELVKLLEEVKNPDPAPTTVLILDYIQRHRIFMHSEAGKLIGNFIKEFEDFFHELYMVIEHLNYVPKTEWKQHKSIQYLIFPGALKTLHRAFEDILDGYYDEAMILLRSTFETFVRLVFLSCYPRDYEAIFHNKHKPKIFIVTEFLRDELKSEMVFIYRLLCAICHSKSHKNLKSAIQRSKNEERGPIVMDYNPDKNFLVMAVNNARLNLCCLFHVMIAIFEEDFMNYQRLKERKEKLHKIDEALLGLIEANTREKFSILAKDLKRIGQVINAADAGQNWQNLTLYNVLP